MADDQQSDTVPIVQASNSSVPESPQHCQVDHSRQDGQMEARHTHLRPKADLSKA